MPQHWRGVVVVKGQFLSKGHTLDLLGVMRSKCSHTYDFQVKTITL